MSRSRLVLKRSSKRPTLEGGGDLEVVYSWCMARTNIDIDEDACAEVMRRYRLATKRDAVNLALRIVAAEPLSVDEARGLRGSGWDGELEAMREGRTPT